MASILIVDDETGIRLLLRQVLEGLGHTVVEAENGKVGLLRYKESPADLVVMDLFMPEKEGLRTIVELQEEFPDVKIIAISGGGRMGRMDLLAMVKDFGVSVALEKPIRIKAFLEAVDAVLA